MARYHYAFYWTYGVGKNGMTGHGRGISWCLIRGLSVTLGLPTTFLMATGIVRPSRQKRRVISWRTRLSVATTIWPSGTTVVGRLLNGMLRLSNWSGHGGVLTCRITRPRITRIDCRDRPLGTRLHGASPSLNNSFRGMAWEPCPAVLRKSSCLAISSLRRCAGKLTRN